MGMKYITCWLGSSKTLSGDWGELDSKYLTDKCSLGDKIICYNFRFKALGIYSFKGEKITCPVLCDRFPTVLYLY